LVCRGKDILAIAPLRVSNDRTGPFSYKKIESIGNVYSPIRSAIFGGMDPEEKMLYLTAVLRHLFYDYRGWDVLDLGPLGSDSEFLRIVQRILCGERRNYVEETNSYNWFLKGIDGSGIEFVNARPKKILAELKRRRRNLEKLGKVEIRIAVDLENLEQHIQWYYDVYSRSWKEKEGIGPTFHRDLALLAAEKGWLRLGFLLLDDYPIATQFRIVYKDICYFLKTAYDRDYKKFSPGVMLLEEMIKYVIDTDKVKYIDFGPGDESYKANWASERRGMVNLFVFNRNFKGRVLEFGKTELAPFVRKHRRLQGLKRRIYESVPSGE